MTQSQTVGPKLSALLCWQRGAHKPTLCPLASDKWSVGTSPLPLWLSQAAEAHSWCRRIPAPALCRGAWRGLSGRGDSTPLPLKGICGQAGLGPELLASYGGEPWGPCQLVRTRCPSPE